MRNEVNVKERKYIMPLPKCPFCSHEENFDDRTYGHYKGPVTCEKCNKRYYVEFGNQSGPDWNGVESGGELLSPIRPVGNPALLEPLEDSSIPDFIFRSFKDASTCSDYGIPRAAAVLCRIAIQESLLQHDIPDDSPEKMVNIARSKGILSEVIHRLCLASVLLGGRGAHPQKNWLDEVGEHEAQQVLLVTQRVLLELFPLDDLPS
jgi:hypothetical protein